MAGQDMTGLAERRVPLVVAFFASAADAALVVGMTSPQAAESELPVGGDILQVLTAFPVHARVHARDALFRHQ